MKRLMPFALMLLLAGCSVEQPLDTSDPAASEKWVAYCYKQAGKNSGLTKASWLLKAYEHAEEAGLISPAEEKVPDQVLQLSVQAKSFSGFTWAIEHGAVPPIHYNDLTAYDKLGREWRDLVLEIRPESLPVFMSLAVDRYDRKFFAAHAEEIMAQGFKVKSPLETTEFKMRYRKFVGDQLKEAQNKGDDEKIRFLIAATPKIENINYVGLHTQNNLKDAADYVFQTLEDEALAIEMLQLNWPIHPVDFDQRPLGRDFLLAYQAKPEYVIRMQGLDNREAPMKASEARFISTLPEEAWAMLSKQHLDELTEETVRMTKSDAAARVIKFKTRNKPLTQADYNELVNWALKHGNKSVFEFVIEQSGELDIFNIDLASMAENQKVFQHYAPKILNRIYYTMDTEPREDGTTIGRIKPVFGAKNENAGLWLVQKYDLIDDWVKATGGQTLLMDVCAGGNVSAARYLIEKRGESVYAETGYTTMQITLFGSSRPTEGRLSPIFFAARSGNPELIKYLVSKGANVNARSNFRTTPLMHAVSARKYEAVKALIALRADVNAQMNPNLEDMDLRRIGSFSDISNAYRRARSMNDRKMLKILTDAGAMP